MSEALNAQINEELFSAYLYLAMSAYAAHKNWLGLASWLQAQAQEERDHALGFYNHLLDRDQAIDLRALQQPEQQFADPLAILTKALEHEQHITGKIRELYDLAVADKDYATQNLLQWYIDEQVEEEASFNQLIEQLKMAGQSGAGFYLFDQSLASRQYVPAAILSKK